VQWLKESKGSCMVLMSLKMWGGLIPISLIWQHQTLMVVIQMLKTWQLVILTSNNVVAIIKVVQLVVIKVQATLWKPHHCSFVCWGFFLNNNLHVDIMNPQMLRCIIYKFEQANENVLTKSCYILKKGFIKYNKCNGVIPIKTHIDCVHPKLLVTKRKQLIEITIPLNHTWQLTKKRVGVTSIAITNFFGFSNIYK